MYANGLQEDRVELVPQSDSVFYFTPRFIKFKFSKESLFLVGSDGSTFTFEKIE